MFFILLLFTSSVGLGEEVKDSNSMCPEDWVDASSVEMGEFLLFWVLQISVPIIRLYSDSQRKPQQDEL